MDYCEDIPPELNELMEQFREQAARLIDMLDLAVPAVVRLKRLLNSLPIHSLPDVCAAIVRASHSERLEILDAVDLSDRFKKTLPLLLRQIEVSLSYTLVVYLMTQMIRSNKSLREKTKE
jgi:ATP-dependent Lon protease